MIVMRRDLHMRKGKIAAQAGHACVSAVLETLCRDAKCESTDDGKEGIAQFKTACTPSLLREWLDSGCAKICVYVDSEEELLAIDRRAKEAGILSALIQDAGITEFGGKPTYTCLAFEPHIAEKVDPITGKLPLY